MIKPSNPIASRWSIMHMLRHLFYSLALMVGMSSCIRENPFHEGEGKRPVYISLSQLDSVKNLPPQTIGLTGTIYLRDTLFFMLEQKKGVHVYHIAENQEPFPLTFFQIPAVSDFSLNDDVLYADSWKDLLAIDISDIYHITLLSRTKNVFTPFLSPPLYNGIFECADDSKGAIIGWEDAYLENAKCETFN